MAMKDQPKEFYAIFEVEKKDLTYSNRGFDKVIVNFVRIETVCSK